MTEAEVLRILGKPMEREAPPENDPADGANRIYLYRWVYGQIDFKSSQVPQPCEFYIHFSKGRVYEKGDPFGTPLSTDGKPTIPRLIYPVSGVIYSHYPRYLDLRWYPSSGQYPMQYVVERQWGNDYPNEENGTVKSKCLWDSHSIATCRVDIPYLLWLHVGANPGRWRVKAVNAIGESQWSEYREYRFNV